jgi:hypothetical protein
MSGSTPNGYPYPDDSDPVAQGAQAIKALATKVDTQLRASAAGTASISVSNAALGSVAVTLPAGRFTAPPRVAVTSGNSAFFGSVSAQSATSFNASVRVWNNVATTATVPVDWIASVSG